MPTPNSSSEQMFDIHADPEFAAQFDVQPGDQILGTSTARLSTAHARRRLRCNIGRTEQQVRLVAGAALVTAAALTPIGKTWRLAMAVFGASQLVTGAMRYCPLWQALRMDTRQPQERFRDTV